MAANQAPPFHVNLRGFFGGDNFGDNLMAAAITGVIGRAAQRAGQSVVASGSGIEVAQDLDPELGMELVGTTADGVKSSGRRGHLSLLSASMASVVRFRGYRAAVKGWFRAGMLVAAWSTRTVLHASGVRRSASLSALETINVVHYIGGGYIASAFMDRVLAEILFVWSYRRVHPAPRVIATGLGVGPLYRGWERRAARALLSQLDSITVRETSSLELVKDIGVMTPTTLALDDALLLLDARPLEGRGARVALNLKSFSGLRYNRDKVERLVNALRRRWPSVDLVRLSGDDRVLSGALGVDDLFDRVVDFSDMTWPDIYSVIAEYGAAVGSAYHFCVLFAARGIPIVATYQGEYYRQKITGVVPTLSDAAVVVAYEDVTGDNVLTLIETAAKSNGPRSGLANDCRRQRLAYEAAYVEEMTHTPRSQ